MNEPLTSFVIYLQIWSKELQYDIKNIFRYKLKLAAVIFFTFFLISFLSLGFYRIINYIKDTPIVGYALVGRVISMVFLSLFIMLIYSSVITAFSTLFLSRDNNFLIVTPFDWGGVLLGKLIQTTFHASWMSCIVLIPLFGVLQFIFKLNLLSYFIILPGTLLYFFSASSLGLLIVMGIVKLFPARKVRDLLIIGVVVLGTSMYLLFRFLNLEQILRPGQGSIVASYMKYLELPKTPYLPSFWISKIMIAFVNKRPGWLEAFLVLLISVIIMIMIFYFITKKYFYNSWEKVQSEEKKRFFKKSFPRNAILAKDIKSFFRDTGQWTQLALIIAIIILYIVNIYKLPLDFAYLQYLIAFLNIGMLGAVIASVGLRFSFSSISLEGKHFWILLSAPVERKKIMFQKYIENFIPVAAMGIILVVVSNIILNPPSLINILSIVTVIVFSITITSMGIGMGALYPKFNAVNPAEVESSWGAVMYMIYSFFYVGITLVLEAIWIRMYFYLQIRGVPIYYPSVAVVICLLLVVNIIANIIPLKLGMRNLKSIEFHV